MPAYGSYKHIDTITSRDSFSPDCICCRLDVTRSKLYTNIQSFLNARSTTLHKIISMRLYFYGQKRCLWPKHMMFAYVQITFFSHVFSAHFYKQNIPQTFMNISRALRTAIFPKIEMIVGVVKSSPSCRQY